MNNKKKIIITVSVIVAVVAMTVVGAILALANKNLVDGEVVAVSKLDYNKKATGEKLDLGEVPKENTQEAKEFIINLYNIANENLKNDTKVAYYVNTQSQVLGVPTGGYRFYVKNGPEYFNADYFFVGETKNALLKGIIQGAAKESTQYAIRSYYNIDDAKGFEQKAKNAKTSISSNKLIVNADWSDLYYNKEIEVPVFMAQSEEELKYCDFILDVDTIKTCSIEYNSKKGYYTIKLTLDCELEKTLGDSLKYLQEGAGDPTAVYTSITQTIEIWDNGRYKTHFSYNAWHAPKAYKVMNMKSANDYKTYFMYDDYSTNIANYPYTEDLKSLYIA